MTVEGQPRRVPTECAPVAQTGKGEASPPESVLNAFPQHRVRVMGAALRQSCLCSWRELGAVAKASDPGDDPGLK